MSVSEYLIFKKKKRNNHTGGNAVGVSKENYGKMRDIAKECDITMTDVANKLIGFAINYIEFEEDNE